MQDILAYVNHIRQAGEYTTYSGRKFKYDKREPLSLSGILQHIAQEYADSLPSNHGPEGSFTERGEMLVGHHQWSTWAEIVTVRFSVEDAVDSWMNSDKGHRDALLNPQYYRAGFGKTPGEIGWVNGKQQPVYHFVGWLGRFYTDEPIETPEPPKQHVFIPLVYG